MFTFLKIRAKALVLKNLLYVSSATLISLLIGYGYFLAIQLTVPEIKTMQEMQTFTKLPIRKIIGSFFPFQLDRDGLLYIGLVTAIFFLLYIPLSISIKSFLLQVSNEEEVKFADVFSIFFDISAIGKSILLYFLMGVYFIGFLIIGLLFANFMGSLGLIFYIFLLVYSAIVLSNAPWFYVIEGGIFNAISKSIYLTTKNISAYILFRISFIFWDMFGYSFPPISLFYEPYLGVAKVGFIKGILENER